MLSCPEIPSHGSLPFCPVYNYSRCITPPWRVGSEVSFHLRVGLTPESSLPGRGPRWCSALLWGCYCYWAAEKAAGDGHCGLWRHASMPLEETCSGARELGAKVFISLCSAESRSWVPSQRSLLWLVLTDLQIQVFWAFTSPIYSSLQWDNHFVYSHGLLQLFMNVVFWKG